MNSYHPVADPPLQGRVSPVNGSVFPDRVAVPYPRPKHPQQSPRPAPPTSSWIPFETPKKSEQQRQQSASSAMPVKTTALVEGAIEDSSRNISSDPSPIPSPPSAPVAIFQRLAAVATGGEEKKEDEESSNWFGDLFGFSSGKDDTNKNDKQAKPVGEKEPEAKSSSFFPMALFPQDSSNNGWGLWGKQDSPKQNKKPSTDVFPVRVESMSPTPFPRPAPATAPFSAPVAAHVPAAVEHVVVRTPPRTPTRDAEKPALDGTGPSAGLDIKLEKDNIQKRLLVQGVMPGGGGHAAGIRGGDEIVGVAGVDIKSMWADVMSALRGPLGSSVLLQLKRVDGSREDVVVTRGGGAAGSPMKTILPDASTTEWSKSRAQESKDKNNVPVQKAKQPPPAIVIQQHKPPLRPETRTDGAGPSQALVPEGGSISRRSFAAAQAQAGAAAHVSTANEPNKVHIGQASQTAVNEQPSSSGNVSEPAKVYDCAVVGAGIAGLFTAYRLVLASPSHPHPRPKIAVFEASGRVGGRIDSLCFDPNGCPTDTEDPVNDDEGQSASALIELGAGWYEQGTHSLMGRLVENLGITSLSASTNEGLGRAVDGSMPTLAKLSSNEQSAVAQDARPAPKQRLVNGVLTPAHPPALPPRLGAAFSLLRYGLQLVVDAMGYKWKVDELDADRSQRGQEKGHNGRPGLSSRLAQWRIGVYRGVPLTALGLWEVLSTVLSHEAVEFIRTRGPVVHGLHIGVNPNASEAGAAIIESLACHDSAGGGSLMRPHGGMSRIVSALETFLLRNGVEVFRGHTLVQMNATPGMVGSLSCDVAQMTFSTLSPRRTTVDAGRVFLALPKAALAKVTGLPADVSMHLHSVDSVPLMRIFAIVRSPPFSALSVPLPNTGVSFAPVRDAVFAHRVDNKEMGWGILTATVDAQWLPYWRGAREQPFGPQIDPEAYTWANMQSQGQDGDDVEGDPSIPGVRLRAMTRRLVLALVQDVFPDWSPKASDFVHFGIRDWDAAPTSCGVHAWRLGIAPAQVMKRFAGFALDSPRARSSKDSQYVHIVGEAYSPLQGTVEGALRSVDVAMLRAGGAQWH